MALQPLLDELLGRMLPVVKNFHGQAMFAPHAGTVDRSGEFKGRALTNDGSASLSVSQAIDHFEASFRELASQGSLRASAIFYHASGIDTSSDKVMLPPASTVEECHGIVALLEHEAGQSVYLFIPYEGSGASIEYTIGTFIEKPNRVFLTPLNGEPKKPWWKLW